MSKPERQKYKIAGPATWELIRAAYLAGESAPALAERFGVSAHAIRKRITVEKWTKRAYAEALEARGLEAPARPKTLNVAERFAANYAPPPAPPAPQAEEHPFMALVAALKEAAAAAESGKSSDDLLDPPAAVETAAVLERRALAQAAAAISKGRASDAKTFAALAEQMRKHAAEEALAEPRGVTDEMMAAFADDLFAKVAYVAAVMLHAPSLAPNGLIDMIKQWREINLGEGEADAEAAARKIAESNAHFLNGEWAATMPEAVQKRLDANWKRYREKGRIWQWGPEYLAEVEGEAAGEGDEGED